MTDVWTAHDIKAALCRRYGTLKTFAQAVGYARSTVSGALTRYVPGVHKQIEATIGVERSKLWPHIYLPDGTVRPEYRPRDGMLTAAAAHDQSEAAA